MQTNGRDNQSKLFRFFEEELQDIYWAEKALIKAIPKMAKSVTSPQLRDALENHLQQTRGHAGRLEKIFEMIGKKAETKKCKAMDGLIDEAGEIIDDTEEGAMRDAGVIAAGQKVEHYEIASYGTLKSYARILGYHDAVTLLEQTLEEEKKADEKLTKLGMSSINEAAAHEMVEE
ncbi:MAG TPA: ferritin-like domain-containing protein [Puia sp.]|nr:ferritin-like domain-containing protein [Puia sp.]